MTGERRFALPGVVLDANVLVQATVRDTPLRAAEAGLDLPFWRDRIPPEVARNFGRVAGRAGDALEQAARLLDASRTSFPDSLVTDYAGLLPELTNDPADRHVLAAAVRIGATLIVTNNTRHFPARALAPHGIAALTPDGFLVQPLARHPAAMATPLAEQGAVPHTSRSTDEVPASRIPHAPTFVAAARRGR